MSKDNVITMNGTVTSVLPAGTFKVKLENGHQVLGHLSGKMRKNHIRILENDKDIYYSLMVFILYLFYVQIMSGNLISKFNEIYYENLILGKKTPIPLFILSKIIEIKKRKM